jgi:hypothetical protein
MPKSGKSQFYYWKLAGFIATVIIMLSIPMYIVKNKKSKNQPAEVRITIKNN